MNFTKIDLIERNSYLEKFRLAHCLESDYINDYLSRILRGNIQKYIRQSILVQEIIDRPTYEYICILWPFRTITKTCPCNIQQYFTAVKKLIFR